VSAAPARPRPAAVYAIADAGRLGAERLADAVVAMAEAGIGTVQLRAKPMADDALAALCEGLWPRLAGWRGALWIDDRVDVARLAPFAGVHLGQHDLPPVEARRLLDDPQAIGLSTHDDDQLTAGDRDAAVDWLAIGPIFPTASKERPDPVVGLAGLVRGRALTAKPVVAIGGIDERNIARVLAAGADSAAVLSAACDGDVAANCRRLLRAAEGAA
jgi:thiamine-phosphate pyrophosphorylase